MPKIASDDLKADMLYVAYDIVNEGNNARCICSMLNLQAAKGWLAYKSRKLNPIYIL
jgi:hypothetical protein